MKYVLGFILLFSLHAAVAVEPDEMLKDPALEARARSISQNLRCLVCQGEDIDDSRAPLAHDLRVLVRERLMKGDRDDQVLQFVRERYGDYVLMTPPVEWRTLALWSAPPLMLIAGLALAFATAFKKRRRR